MSNHPLADKLSPVPDFPKPGILFQDISPLLKHHFNETIDAMAALFSEQEWDSVDYLVGIESRGYLFASALAYRYNKGLVMARKPGKLPNVEATVKYGLEYGSDELQMQKGHGEKVIILDDLIATGGSMGAAAELSEKVGFEVLGMACLIDLKALNSFQYQDKVVRSVIQFED